MPSAEAGDNIGFNLRGVEKKDIKRGDVLGTPDAPPNVAKEFKAQIIVIHHPTAIAPGYTPVMHAHTTQVAATVTEFLQKINPATGAVEEENPKVPQSWRFCNCKNQTGETNMYRNLPRIP